MSETPSIAAWAQSLKVGEKVIVQTTWGYPFLEPVQAVARQVVYAGHLCFRLTGEHYVSRVGPRQAWLLPPSEELVDLINHGNRYWNKQDWDTFRETKLDTIPGNYKPKLPPLHIWSVLGTGDQLNRFNEFWLTEPLYLKESRRIVFGDEANSVDLFDPSVDTESIHRVFAVMALCPQHQFFIQSHNHVRMMTYARDEALEELGGDGDASSGIGQAASCMLDGDWIWNEGKPFRKAIEDLIYLADGLEPGTESDCPASEDLLPLSNVTFKTLRKAEAAHA
ncbi:MAG: DUF5131 family protein [Armatimonadota bacterium]